MMFRPAHERWGMDHIVAGVAEMAGQQNEPSDLLSHTETLLGHTKQLAV